MDNPIMIADPRKNRDNSTEDEGNSPLVFFMPKREQPIRDSVLLCNLLWAFPADKVLYLIDGPDKKVARIASGFVPERWLNAFTGIVSTSDAYKLRLSNFFDQNGSWFEWSFYVFDENRLPEIEEVVNRRQKVEGQTDPLASYVRYSLRCNRDMGQKEVLVYDKDLFDPMIDLMITLR